MLDTAVIKKNKISLSDYNYQRDIENRLLMSEFTILDLAVLEEILYSSLILPISKLAKNIDESEENIQSVLAKLESTGLFKIDQGTLYIDKEMRKYFESEVAKFEPDFKPDMEFLQNLLKKVPMHALLLWYPIPRSSNNIFESLVEKFLATPIIFQRYLMEMNAGDPVLAAIAQDVFRSPNLSVTARDLCIKYSLTREQFEENMLLLEFSFICCIGYKREEERWVEIVTPFKEWNDHLNFLKTTVTESIIDSTLVDRLRPLDFAFVQDMSTILQACKKQPFSLTNVSLMQLMNDHPELSSDLTYVERVIQKLHLLNLINITLNQVQIGEDAHEWLEMRAENRAMYLYRHPANRIPIADVSPYLWTEKNVREAEKSIVRVLYTGWVLFDEFIKGVHIPLHDHAPIHLRKNGKSWMYVRPVYQDNEIEFLKAIIFEWFFESGITAIGTYNGRECFCVTPFGQSLLS